MIVYENKNLHGRSGNTGWLITIPAGKINMKVSWDMNKDNVTWAEPTAQHRTTAIMIIIWIIHCLFRDCRAILGTDIL